MDALLSDTTASWALRPVSDLVVAEAAARQAFDELTGQPMDYDSPLEGEVRRFDLAHEFRFEQGRDGLAFLRTLSGMCPPRRKLQTVTGQDGQPQTVYVRH